MTLITAVLVWTVLIAFAAFVVVLIGATILLVRDARRAVTLDRISDELDRIWRLS